MPCIGHKDHVTQNSQSQSKGGGGRHAPVPRQQRILLQLALVGAAVAAASCVAGDDARQLGGAVGWWQGNACGSVNYPGCTGHAESVVLALLAPGRAVRAGRVQGGRSSACAQAVLRHCRCSRPAPPKHIPDHAQLLCHGTGRGPPASPRGSFACRAPAAGRGSWRETGSRSGSSHSAGRRI